MTYSKALPRIDNILWLTQLARPFPATAEKIMEAAQRWHFSRATIDFLKLFPSHTEFEDGDDFFTRSQELQMLIREERKMPFEILRSPQG